MNEFVQISELEKKNHKRVEAQVQKALSDVRK